MLLKIISNRSKKYTVWKKRICNNFFKCGEICDWSYANPIWGTVSPNMRKCANTESHMGKYFPQSGLIPDPLQITLFCTSVRKLTLYGWTQQYSELFRICGTVLNSVTSPGTAPNVPIYSKPTGSSHIYFWTDQWETLVRTPTNKMARISTQTAIMKFWSLYKRRFFFVFAGIRYAY